MNSRALPILLGLLLPVGACSTTKYQGPVVTPAAVANISAENPGATLMVDVAGNPIAPEPRRDSSAPELARLVDIAPDHATLALSSEAAARVVPNDSIQRIVVAHRSQAPLVGAGIGVFVGVAAALAASHHSDPCAQSTSWGCVEISNVPSPLEVGLLVGVPAALIGAAVGAAISPRTDYTFGPPAVARAD